MKKTLKFAGALVCAILLLGIGTGRIHARLTGTDPGTDVWCVGPSGAEICVDATGNIIPGTTNVGSLGTSSLKFKDFFLAGNASVGGTMAITGATTQTGAFTVTGETTLNGRMVRGVTAVGTGTAGLGVYISTTIPATSSYETVISSGSAILLTSTPNISTTTTLTSGVNLTNGTMLVITSTAAAGSVAFQDEGTLTGSLLQLGAASRTVGQYDVLTLIFNSSTGYWHEVSYTNN